MKKFILLLGFLVFPLMAYATTLTEPYCNESTGGYILASHWNGNCAATQTWANNGNIDGTTNIGAGAIGTSNVANLAITDAKIATAGITSTGKLNGTAFTNLNGIPNSAGEIPTANLGTGTANSTTFLSGAQTWTSVGSLIGTPTSQTIGSTYQAATDGFVTAYGYTSSGVSDIQIQTDSNSNPTTVVGMNTSPINQYAGIFAVIKKNNYYKVSFVVGGGTGNTMYFVPMGS